MKLWRNYFMTYVSLWQFFAPFFDCKAGRSNDVDFSVKLNSETIEHLSLDSL